MLRSSFDQWVAPIKKGADIEKQIADGNQRVPTLAQANYDTGQLTIIRACL
jgi:hypothetical protein